MLMWSSHSLYPIAVLSVMYVNTPLGSDSATDNCNSGKPVRVGCDRQITSCVRQPSNFSNLSNWILGILVRFSSSSQFWKVCTSWWCLTWKNSWGSTNYCALRNVWCTPKRCSLWIINSILFFNQLGC